MTEKETKKMRKALKSVYFYALSTSLNDFPQATMVQPALTEDWRLLVLSDKRTKKVRNIQENDKVWLIADKTGIFKIPKAIYIKGTANLIQLTKEKFNEVLSYHGIVTRKIFRSLVKNGFDDSVIIEVIPTKFITLGIFSKSNEQISFQVPTI